MRGKILRNLGGKSPKMSEENPQKIRGKIPKKGKVSKKSHAKNGKKINKISDFIKF